LLKSKAITAISCAAALEARMAFAILRTEKLKSMGEVGGSLSHNYRTRPTPNANTEIKNWHSISTASGAMEAIKNRLPEKNRKNAVLCVEHLITASPEWDAWGTQKETDFFNESLKWLRSLYGSENVVAASVHHDETTPHLVAYVVPVDTTGRLNARRWLGGRENLSAMQTSFAKQVKNLGLERGLEGSKARHTTVKEFYAEIQKPILQKEIKPIHIKKFDSELPEKKIFESSESYAQKVVDVVFDDARMQAEQARKFYLDEIAAIHDHYQRALRLEQIKTESEKVARRRAEDAATKLSKEVIGLRKDFDEKVADIKREEDRLEKLYGTYFEFKYLYPEDACQLEEKMKVKIYNHPKKVIEREARQDYEQHLSERQQQIEQKRQEREYQKQIERDQERKQQLSERQQQIEQKRQEREHQKQIERDQECKQQLELGRGVQNLKPEIKSQPEKVPAQRIEEDFNLGM
jgi:hypothetical protein